MSDQCATCGAADVILFTCGYCGRVFCADHDLPHHSCEGFAHPGEGADEVTFEWETGGRTDTEDAFTGSGFRPAASGGETARTPAPRPVTEATTPAIEPLPREETGEGAAAAVRPAPRRPPGPAEQAIRSAPEPEPTTAAPSATPATAGTATATTPDEPSSGANIRTMDAKHSPGSVERREPRTLTEWLDQQTYVSLSVKTAALATVINGALYLGMMITRYGLVPF